MVNPVIPCVLRILFKGRPDFDIASRWTPFVKSTQEFMSKKYMDCSNAVSTQFNTCIYTNEWTLVDETYCVGIFVVAAVVVIVPMFLCFMRCFGRKQRVEGEHNVEQDVESRAKQAKRVVEELRLHADGGAVGAEDVAREAAKAAAAAAAAAKAAAAKAAVEKAELARQQAANQAAVDKAAAEKAELARQEAANQAAADKALRDQARAYQAAVEEAAANPAAAAPDGVTEKLRQLCGEHNLPPDLTQKILLITGTDRAANFERISLLRTAKFGAHVYSKFVIKNT